MRMGPWVDKNVQPFPVRRINWRGRSGRLYLLEPVRLGDFALRNNELYMIALGSHVLWTGSAEDVIQDATSRASFRLALDCADRAYRVDAAEDQVERMTTIWDLEGAEPVTGVVAA
jgi:hypothetical protein